MTLFNIAGDDTTELTLSDVVKTTPSNFWDQLEVCVQLPSVERLTLARTSRPFRF